VTALGLQIIWRETYSQHFGSPDTASNSTRVDGAYDERRRALYANESRTCQPLSRPRGEKPSVLAAVERMLLGDGSNENGSGVSFLPTWATTSPHPELHVGRHALGHPISHANTSHAKRSASSFATSSAAASSSGVIDCTHYCLFSGVDAAVLDALAALIWSHSALEQRTQQPADAASATEQEANELTAKKAVGKCLGHGAAPVETM